MPTKINTTIQFKRGSSNNIQSTVLAKGEPGYDVTNNILKIGDGTTSWGGLKEVSTFPKPTYAIGIDDEQCICAIQADLTEVVQEGNDEVISLYIPKNITTIPSNIFNLFPQIYTLYIENSEGQVYFDSDVQSRIDNQELIVEYTNHFNFNDLIISSEVKLKELKDQFEELIAELQQIIDDYDYEDGNEGVY